MDWSIFVLFLLGSIFGANANECWSISTILASSRLSEMKSAIGDSHCAVLSYCVFGFAFCDYDAVCPSSVADTPENRKLLGVDESARWFKKDAYDRKRARFTNQDCRLVSLADFETCVHFDIQVPCANPNIFNETAPNIRSKRSPPEEGSRRRPYPINSNDPNKPSTSKAPRIDLNAQLQLEIESFKAHCAQTKDCHVCDLSTSKDAQGKQAMCIYTDEKGKRQERKRLPDDVFIYIEGDSIEKIEKRLLKGKIMRKICSTYQCTRRVDDKKYSQQGLCNVHGQRGSQTIEQQICKLAVRLDFSDNSVRFETTLSEKIGQTILDISKIHAGLALTSNLDGLFKKPKPDFLPSDFEWKRESFFDKGGSHHVKTDLSFWRKTAKFVYQKLGYGNRITERFELVDFSGGWRQTQVVNGQIEIIDPKFVARKAVAKLIQFDQQMERPSYIPERKPKWYEDAVPDLPFVSLNGGDTSFHKDFKEYRRKTGDMTSVSALLKMILIAGYKHFGYDHLLPSKELKGQYPAAYPLTMTKDDVDGKEKITVEWALDESGNYNGLQAAKKNLNKASSMAPSSNLQAFDSAVPARLTKTITEVNQMHDVPNEARFYNYAYFTGTQYDSMFYAGEGTAWRKFQHLAVVKILLDLGKLDEYAKYKKFFEKIQKHGAIYLYQFDGFKSKKEVRYKEHLMIHTGFKNPGLINVCDNRNDWENIHQHLQPNDDLSILMSLKKQLDGAQKHGKLLKIDLDFINKLVIPVNVLEKIKSEIKDGKNLIKTVDHVLYGSMKAIYNANKKLFNGDQSKPTESVPEIEGGEEDYSIDEDDEDDEYDLDESLE